MLDWDFEKNFHILLFNPFEMYKKFIYSSKCNVFKHSTFLGQFVQAICLGLVITVTSRVRGRRVGG